MINNVYSSTNSNGTKVIDFYEIDEIDDVLEKTINEYIITICSGKREIDIKLVKDKIRKFLIMQDDKTKWGATAEFFGHLELNRKGYKQECLFFNLEENSIKKGFDGYYSIGDEEWIMESKSGYHSTKGISHQNKIKEAYCDLDNKIKGKVENNPWDNAYNHAAHCDVATVSEIRNNINNFSIDFKSGIFPNISSLNLIPCTTIFYDGIIAKTNYEQIMKDIELSDNKLKYKKIKILCFNQNSIQMFIDYLNK